MKNFAYSEVQFFLFHVNLVYSMDEYFNKRLRNVLTYYIKVNIVDRFLVSQCFSILIRDDLPTNVRTAPAEVLNACSLLKQKLNMNSVFISYNIFMLVNL